MKETIEYQTGFEDGMKFAVVNMREYTRQMQKDIKDIWI